MNKPFNFNGLRVSVLDTSGPNRIGRIVSELITEQRLQYHAETMPGGASYAVPNTVAEAVVVVLWEDDKSFATVNIDRCRCIDEDPVLSSADMKLNRLKALRINLGNILSEVAVLPNSKDTIKEMIHLIRNITTTAKESADYTDEQLTHFEKFGFYYDLSVDEIVLDEEAITDLGTQLSLIKNKLIAANKEIEKEDESQHKEQVTKVGTELTELLRKAIEAQTPEIMQLVLSDIYAKTIPSLNNVIDPNLPKLSKVVVDGLYTGIDPALVVFEPVALDAIKQNLDFIISSPGGVHLQRTVFSGPSNDLQSISIEETDAKFVRLLKAALQVQKRETVDKLLLHIYRRSVMTMADLTLEEMPTLESVFENGIYSSISAVNILLNKEFISVIVEELKYLIEHPAGVVVSEVDQKEIVEVEDKHEALSEEQYASLVDAVGKELTTLVRDIFNTKGGNEALELLNIIYSSTVRGETPIVTLGVLSKVLEFGVYYVYKPDELNIESDTVTKIKVTAGL